VNQLEEFVSTIPSRQLEVWRRLYDRYSLEPRPATVVPDVSKTIVPITDADALLVNNGAILTTTSFGAAISSFENVFIVPADTRVQVSVISIVRTGGDNEWDQVQLLDVSRNIAIPLSFEVNQTAQVILLGANLIMESNDRVRILFNGTGVAGTNISGTIWSGEEANF